MTTGSARYRVIHETYYDYHQPISSGRHLAHLTPRDTAWQTCTAHQITIEPPPDEQSRAVDYFGNPVLRFAHDSAQLTLKVRADSEVEVESQARLWRTTLSWEEVAVDGSARLTADDPALTEYRLASPLVPLLAEAGAYVRESLTPRRALVDALQELTLRIRDDFVYDPQATTVATALTQVVAQRRGVCQDFAHFMLSGLRGLGLAARYMSGYIVNEPDPAGGGGAVGADASHAWVAVCGADGTWIGCDPTNGKLADLEFVTLGWGRDFNDVTPLRGVVLGADTDAPKVAVRVTRR